MRLTRVSVYSEESTNKDSEKKLKVSPPWYGYYRKVYNLFKNDPDLSISDLTEVEENEYEFKIASKNAVKLTAIQDLIGSGVVGGGAKVKIVYEVKTENKTWGDVFADAFEGNPLFKQVIKQDDPLTETSRYYAIFSRDIVSYFNDNYGDYTGKEHYIPADLVKDVIKAETNVSICTESVDTK